MYYIKNILIPLYTLFHMAGFYPKAINKYELARGPKKVA